MEKKKIALIIDTENWAFDNIAKQIKKNLVEYDIDIIPGRIFEGNILRLFLFCSDYDLVHFLWRGYLSLINRKEMQEYTENYLKISFEEFKKKYVYSKKITFGVCDHLYLRGEEKWRTDEVFKFSNSYFVTSQKLYDIYSEFDNKPKMIIHDGVDLSSYKPENLERFNNLERKIVFGWVGNSKFKDSDGDEDMKGVEGIIKPAISELQQEGYNVELKLADRNLGMIAQEDMPDFYNSIDVYICASKEEGTPLTIQESMAMGIPIISTDVGIVSEVFGENQKKYIMKERSKQELKNKIKELLENKERMKELSKENLEHVKTEDWKNICKKYKEFFENKLMEK